MLLAQHNEVVVIDIDGGRLALLKAQQCPVEDADIEEFLRNRHIRFKATLDKHAAYADADFVIIATPTDYDPVTNHFDTTSIESVVQDVIAIAPRAIVVIKSIVPVSNTAKLCAPTGSENIIFSPEFLREGTDNPHPSRMLVGALSLRAKKYVALLQQGAVKQNTDVLLTSSDEAVKLFANTYLAMRVAFFNELDTYAATHGLDTPPNHRRSVPGSTYWQPLQQAQLWLGRILSAQRREAAACQLQRCAAKHCARHCGQQQQRLLCRRHIGTQAESSRHLPLGHESGF